MKLSTIIWIIVAIIIVAGLGWWVWGYLYPTNTVSDYQVTPNETQNQESVNNNQDLTAAEQSLEATSFTEIDASLNQNNADQNSF